MFGRRPSRWAFAHILVVSTFRRGRRIEWTPSVGRGIRWCVRPVCDACEITAASAAAVTICPSDTTYSGLIH